MLCFDVIVPVRNNIIVKRSVKIRTKQTLLHITLIGMVVILRGCVVAAVGLGAAGTIAYVRGDLEAVESESLEDVYQATLQAVEELDLRLIYKSRDALSATITARDAQDKKIRITLKNNSRENDENLDSHRNIRYRNKIKAYLSADTR